MVKSGVSKTLKVRKDENEATLSEFNAAWPKVLNSVLEDPHFQEIFESMVWLKEVMVKNVPHGKKSRAMMGLCMYRKLAPERTADDDFNFIITAWCMEIFQAAALMADDIMDSSLTRRGKECWYLRDNVGMSAVNDVLLLENIVYYIMIQFMGNKEYYVKMSHFVHTMGIKTILGQSLDTRFFIPDGFDISKCTMSNYASIVKFKTGYYTFYCPIGLAMITAGVKDETLFDAVEGVTLEMGQLFQIQDDFLDCYGDPETTGKMGTDIIDGKCTWLICKAAELVNDAQRKQLQECYGRKSAVDKQVVLKVYKDLRIPHLYAKQEKNLRDKIANSIQKLPLEIPQEPLRAVLSGLYRRRK